MIVADVLREYDEAAAAFFALRAGVDSLEDVTRAFERYDAAAERRAALLRP